MVKVILIEAIKISIYERLLFIELPDVILNFAPNSFYYSSHGIKELKELITLSFTFFNRYPIACAICLAGNVGKTKGKRAF